MRFENLGELREAIEDAASNGDVGLTQILCLKLPVMTQKFIAKARELREEAITLQNESLTQEEERASQMAYRSTDRTLMSGIEFYRNIQQYAQDSIQIAKINSQFGNYRSEVA